MNYYFPYGAIPYVENTAAKGLLGRIFKNGINWSSILTNTQKTLNIINQTIPVVKQIGPVVNNAKTMFKVMNEFKKIETPQQPEKQQKNSEPIKEEKIINTSQNTPTFFQ